MQERLNNIFQANKDMCVSTPVSLDPLNADIVRSYLEQVSGSGKTRILLEGLCRHWGLYLSCYSLESSALECGATDMPFGISQCGFEEGFTCGLPSRDSPDFIEKEMKNCAIARVLFSRIVLVRLIVFNVFMEEVLKHHPQLHTEESRMNYRRKWLLLQLRPGKMLELPQDIFSHLVTKLISRWPGATLDDLQTHIDTLLTNIHQHLATITPEEKETIFIVIDEAQHPANTLQRAFYSQANYADADQYQPLLHEILATISKVTFSFDCRIVTAGTGISATVMDAVLPSAIRNKDSYLQYSDTGNFGDEVTHMRYIKKYIPPSLSNEPLLHRIHHWLRGR